MKQREALMKQVSQNVLGTFTTVAHAADAQAVLSHEVGERRYFCFGTFDRCVILVAPRRR